MAVQKDPEQNETKHLRRHADLSGKRILEVGSGDGRLTWRYAQVAGHVTGIDVDWDGLRVASIERASDLEHRAAFAQADLIHLPFAKEAFDTVLLAWSF
jgi:ubiquinone/menaquinone biosynthesis C-methylase UbiE